MTRADLLIEYGRAYAYSGDLVEAFRQYLQADTLLQRVEPVIDDSDARVLNRIGDCMFYMQNWRTGYRYAEQSAQIATALNNHQYRIRSITMKAAYVNSSSPGGSEATPRR